MLHLTARQARRGLGRRWRRADLRGGASRVRFSRPLSIASLSSSCAALQDALSLLTDVARDRRLVLLEASVIFLILLEIVLSLFPPLVGAYSVLIKPPSITKFVPVTFAWCARKRASRPASPLPRAW